MNQHWLLPYATVAPFIPAGLVKIAYPLEPIAPDRIVGVDARTIVRHYAGGFAEVFEVWYSCGRGLACEGRP
jgi:hypothetical protein